MCDVLFYSVDRDRLRERERQARAAMSVQAEQAAAASDPDTIRHVVVHLNAPNANDDTLFAAPVKVCVTYIYFYALLYS